MNAPEGEHAAATELQLPVSVQVAPQLHEVFLHAAMTALKHAAFLPPESPLLVATSSAQQR